MIRLNRHLLLACIALAAACANKTDTTTAADERPTTPPPSGTELPDDDTTTADPTTGTAGTTGSTGSTGMTGEGGMAAGAATGMPTTDPTDAEIAHILTTANTAEIESSNLALKKSTNPSVQTFAKQMVTDHTATNDKTKALASTLALTPQDNEISKSMEQQADTATERLQVLEGAAFDKVYVDTAVQMHTLVLESIDEVLLPNADSAELKALLTDVRPTISAHLDHAKKLQTTLTPSLQKN